MGLRSSHLSTAVPRGVHKYRSIEEANADRDRWEEAYFQAFHERRRAKPVLP